MGTTSNGKEEEHKEVDGEDKSEAGSELSATSGLEDQDDSDADMDKDDEEEKEMDDDDA